MHTTNIICNNKYNNIKKCQWPTAARARKVKSVQVASLASLACFITIDNILYSYKRRERHNRLPNIVLIVVFLLSQLTTTWFVGDFTLFVGVQRSKRAEWCGWVKNRMCAREAKEKSSLRASARFGKCFCHTYISCRKIGKSLFFRVLRDIWVLFREHCG
jgi:hypothetical protein